MARLVRATGRGYHGGMSPYAVCLMLAMAMLGALVLMWAHPWALLGVALASCGFWLLSHDQDPGIVLAGRESLILNLGLSMVAAGALTTVAAVALT